MSRQTTRPSVSWSQITPWVLHHLLDHGPMTADELAAAFRRTPGASSGGDMLRAGEGDQDRGSAVLVAWVLRDAGLEPDETGRYAIPEGTESLPGSRGKQSRVRLVPRAEREANQETFRRQQWRHGTDPFHPEVGKWRENLPGRAFTEDADDINQLLLSIQTEGWNKDLAGLPMLDEHGVVLDGHRRLAVLRRLGIEPKLGVHYRTKTFGNGGDASVRRVRWAVFANAGHLTRNTMAALVEDLAQVELATGRKLPPGWVDAMAVALGVDARTVRKDTERIRKRTKAERKTEALRLRAEGATQREAAAAVGVDHSTVMAWERTAEPLVDFGTPTQNPPAPVEPEPMPEPEPEPEPVPTCVVCGLEIGTEDAWFQRGEGLIKRRPNGGGPNQIKHVTWHEERYHMGCTP